MGSWLDGGKWNDKGLHYGAQAERQDQEAYLVLLREPAWRPGILGLTSGQSHCLVGKEGF